MHKRPKLPLLLAWSLITSAAAADAPDLILHHGKVVTVDSKFSIQEAVALKGNRILAVGSNASILDSRDYRTEMIDLKGSMLLPGLIDSHTHPLSAAMTEADHPIPDMATIEDVLAYFRTRAGKVTAGEWVVLQQVFITRLREKRYPTRAELDRAAPNNPAVFRTGPDASFNSLALKQAGIDRDFQIPQGTAGKIEKDANGEPTGILRNFANYTRIPETGRTAADQEKMGRLQELFRDYNSVGLTSIGDRNASPEGIRLYETMLKNSGLSVRIAISHELGSSGSLSEIAQKIEKISNHPLRSDNSTLRIIGVKMFLDGGMLTGSAYMREPWGVSDIYSISDPAYRGVLFIPRDRLLPIVRSTIQAGLQFTAHSVGDGAVETLLGVYDELSREMPIRQTRPCITHANFLTEEIVQKLPKLGVLLDIQPDWLYLDSATLLKQFGNDRLRWFQPLKSLFEAHAIIGGGSDHMQKVGSFRSINPYNPFLGMATAITRKARGLGQPVHPEEALSREQAIRFYTINNAYLLFSEQNVGSIEPGKLADLVVIDTDLLNCPPEQIEKTQVLKTYVGGKLVFSRN
jgi:predicted amidohydrolase YtcJ